MKPTVEVSMIVKDGASCLARCLKSAAPFVDRIVVGDTGSSDESAAIARDHGAEVIPIPWEDDFSRARNRVLAQRKCDWILVLDADEMLDEAGGALIRQLAEDSGVHAYHNPRWNYVCDASTRLGYQAARPNPFLVEEARQYPAYVSLPTTRLFRGHPEIYYEGCVHETVTKRLAALGLPTARAEFVVHHFGHAEEPESVRLKKNDVYQALGEKKLNANPADAQALIEMGLAELEHARRPAVALEHFERACRLSPRSATAWLYGGMCMARLGKLPEALERLERATTLGLQSAVLYQALGDVHYHAGRFAQARLAYTQVAVQGEACPLSEAKLGASEVHLGMARDGIMRMQRAVASAPAFAELYDMLAAGALLSGDVMLAARTLETRLRMGNVTPFQFRLAEIVQARLPELQRKRAEQESSAA